jgi:hypothetical protein
LAAGAACAGSLPCARGGPLRAAAASTWAVSTKIALPTTARLEHLLATAAAEIHAILTSSSNIVVTELLLDARVAVPNALAMRGIMLPVITDVVYVGRTVDVDIVVSPINAATPIVSA